LSWPHVDNSLPNDNSSTTIPLRLEEVAAVYNFAAFISPREFGYVLIGAPTIYLDLLLVCAHWAIVRGWAEPHYLGSHGLCHLARFLYTHPEINTSCPSVIRWKQIVT